MKNYALSALAGTMMLVGVFFMLYGLSHPLSTIIFIGALGAIMNMILAWQRSSILRAIAEGK